MEQREGQRIYVMRRLGERLQVVGVEQASGLEQIRARCAQLEDAGYVTTTLEPGAYARLHGVEVTFA